MSLDECGELGEGDIFDGRKWEEADVMEVGVVGIGEEVGDGDGGRDGFF